MEKLRKKVGGSSIAIVILSVLLVIAFTTIGTFAWFASKDNASSKLTMGEAVTVDLVQKGEGEDVFETSNNALKFTIPTGYLLPGMWIHTDVAAQISKSNSGAYMRFKVTLTDDLGASLGDPMKTQFEKEIARLANINGWYQVTDLQVGGDGEKDTYFYYLGKGKTAASVTKGENLLKIDSTSKAVNTYILGDGKYTGNDPEQPIKTKDNCMQIPTDWTNEVASKVINIKLDIEAIQGWIPVEDDPSNTEALTVEAIQYAFEEAALQA